MTNPAIAPYSIIVVSIWGSLGYNMIILLAGIQGISPTYYEAAEIDGGALLQNFSNITLPLVTPSLFFILITGLIGAFQIFDTIFMMIGKNTVVLENTQSVVMYFYRNAFGAGQQGLCLRDRNAAVRDHHVYHAAADDRTEEMGKLRLMRVITGRSRK